MAPLPLEEEPPSYPIWQAGFVVPHQVPAHEPTMVPRMQSGIQQERVVLGSNRETEGVRYKIIIYLLPSTDATYTTSICLVC